MIYDVYSNYDTDLFYSGDALAKITLEQICWVEFQELQPQFLEKIASLLNSEDSIQKAAGALVVMYIAFNYSRPIDNRKRIDAAFQTDIKNIKKLCVIFLHQQALQ